MGMIRIQKYLADCGVSSRRSAEKMVEAGIVKIGDTTARIGDKLDPENEAVFVDGVLIEPPEALHYYALYKPRGYVTTMQDEKGRKCVRDLLGEISARVYPVGRLDKDSEGLLLLTDDGAFANRMMHPAAHIEKTYRVTVRPDVTAEQLVTLGMPIEIDGRLTSPAIVTVLEREPGRAVLQIKLHEGRNRQIRRMCEAAGLEVARLKRTAIGPVKLGMLAPGELRELSESELRALRGAGKSAQNAPQTIKPQSSRTAAPKREANRKSQKKTPPRNPNSAARKREKKA